MPRREGCSSPTASGREPIAQTFAFYNARADEAAAEAEKATLANVRERALRSEKTWRGLADQAQKVATDREKAAEDRRVRLEREALEQQQAG